MRIIPILPLALLAGCGAGSTSSTTTPPADTPSPGMALPAPTAAGVRFQTAPVDVPANRTCFNKEEGGGFARELLNGLERLVVVHGAEQPIPLEAWPDFEPDRPWAKNQDLHSRFASNCVYRSPLAQGDCVGADCVDTRTVSSYTWNTVAAMLAFECLPQGTGRCNGLAPEPGAMATIVLNKCQTFTLDGDVFIASDGAGNRYAVHATRTPEPRTDVPLPAGWTLTQEVRDAPLEIRPFGQGEECFHVVAFDAAGQLYTQFEFADDVFPANAPPDDWRMIPGADVADFLTQNVVDWPGQGRQTWADDGTTTVPFGSGVWKVETGQYCSMFPGQDWRCFDLKRSPEGGRLRVTGRGGIAWVGTIVGQQ